MNEVPEDFKRDLGNLGHVSAALVAVEERLKLAENTNAALLARIKALEAGIGAVNKAQADHAGVDAMAKELAAVKADLATMQIQMGYKRTEHFSAEPSAAQSH